jgi:hypothetical protein
MNVCEAEIEGFEDLQLQCANLKELYLELANEISFEEISLLTEKWIYFLKMTLILFTLLVSQSQMAVNVIHKMKELTNLTLSRGCSSANLLQLQDEVNNIILPHRPKFLF